MKSSCPINRTSNQQFSPLARSVGLEGFLKKGVFMKKINLSLTVMLLIAASCASKPAANPDDAQFCTASSGVDEISQHSVAHNKILQDEKCVRDLSRTARPAPVNFLGELS